jgi:hypothetical protein
VFAGLFIFWEERTTKGGGERDEEERPVVEVY